MATDDYCELCDLPKSTCVHGMPPAPPPTKPAPKVKTPKVKEPKAPAAPRATSTTATRVETKPVRRRRTPPDWFKPAIVDVLTEADGELDGEQVFTRLEEIVADRLLPGDLEKTPEGELRWRYAARRARQSLITEGVMTKGRPGLWQLA